MDEKKICDCSNTDASKRLVAVQLNVCHATRSKTIVENREHESDGMMLVESRGRKKEREKERGSEMAPVEFATTYRGKMYNK